MTGLKFEEKTKLLGRVSKLNLVYKLLRKRSVVKFSVVAALFWIGALSGDAVFAQQNVNVRSNPTLVSTPWTDQGGREVVSLGQRGVRQSGSKKSTHIRQISAFSQDDYLSNPLEPIGNIEDYEAPEESGDWNRSSLDSGYPSEAEDIPDSVVAPVTPAPRALESDPVAAPQPPKSPSVLSTEVQRYPQSDELSGVSDTARHQGDFSKAVSPAPSTNPYSRIGQTEYNPNQFYGYGGNFSVNGYRNTPPAEAYGQSVCGDCCGGCGVLGGILRNTQVEAGAVSMRSPLDFDDMGNVGAEFSANWGSERPILGGLNIQAGARGVFTDFNGVRANGFITDDSRNQFFWTAGVYFRAPAYSSGWSGGIVYDSLIENYYRKYELSQLRAELSYNFSNFCEIGFRGAFSLDDDWCDFLNLGPDEKVEAKATGSSYYTMFIRKRFLEGAEATFFGGATEWGEGLAGAAVEAPLSDCLALRGSATYVFPKERGLHEKTREESWNISVGLAWNLGGNAHMGADSQRPLFDVADNGSFLQNFLR